jgi:RAMP superfamily
VAGFVNPYTFVPLAADPDRREPAGHAAMGQGQLSGVLRIRVKARTPLLVGGFSRRGPDGVERPDVPRRADGTAMIPGSGLHGAVRSAHEALAGGCLRVLDAERTPMHRHPANTAVTDGLRLAVVREVGDTGLPTRVALCDRVVWVDKNLLPQGPGGRLPRTGDHLSLPWNRAVKSGNRDVLRPEETSPGELAWLSGMASPAVESWVLLVTDTRPRQGKPTAYFGAGRIGPEAPTGAVDAAAAEEYAKVVDGADDLRPEQLPGGARPTWPATPEFRPVLWPPPGRSAGGPPIAERLAARRYLHVGQPVWVRVDGASVTEIRLSQLWRYRGKHAVGERVGAALPCADPEELCWSCRIFGSADISGRDPGAVAAQRSYRGHVRFDDALRTVELAPQPPWQLAPLSSPRPSAGQFYLDHTAVPAARRLAARDTEPAATWGSCADENDPRPIRGRKFYWRTTDPTGSPRPRGRQRSHHSEKLTRDVALIPAGTEFTGRVCFDNLSLADLGSLLAALDPRHVWPHDPGGPEVVVGIGGGKPFGFGSVTIDVQVEQLATAAGRYLGRREAAPSPAAAVRAFMEAVPRSAAANWTALRNALTLGYVADDLVWYPPGAGTTAADKGTDRFDRSFEFFGRTAGLALKNSERPLVELPRADEPPERQVLESDG